jgi:bifunctional non-homologous end joining protein LigD
MLATLVDKPFDDDDWLYEIKWDGYRAVAFLDGNSVRLVSRNQNDLTAAYPELHEIVDHIKARTAILDGEIVAVDDEGRPSFSLMQQRTGVGEGGRRIRRTRDDIPVVYYAFDLLYLDGYDLMQADLEARKRLLASILVPTKSSAIPITTSGAVQPCSKRRRNADWKASSRSAVAVVMNKSAAAIG